MDDVNDDDAAMMAMMGVTGFGTTKVNSPTTSKTQCVTHSHLQGKTSRRQPGRFCQHQENEDMASVYEQVRPLLTH